MHEFNIRFIYIGYTQKNIVPCETINRSMTIKDVLDKLLINMKKKIE